MIDKPITKTLCHNCKCSENIEVLSIKNREHGSCFDGDNTEILLCDKCIDLMDVEREWFDNDASSIFCKETGLVTYINERYITILIDSLPIESQENILNRPNKYYDEVMSKEDWIKEYKNGFFDFK